MADNPKHLRYTKEHEWARRDGAGVVVGSRACAGGAGGRGVRRAPQGGGHRCRDPFGVVESTKAVSELFAPISGKVTKVNTALSDEPATINTDPYGAGWIVEVAPSDPSQLDGLMDADGYNDLLAKTAT